MQPLSYQLAETSCWVACMLNGIRCVLKQDRVATPVYRTVHSLLIDNGVEYYEAEDLKALKEVYLCLQNHTGLEFKCRRRGDVEPTLNCLELNGDEVAICDVGNGTHSILLTERKGHWLSAFDPYWYAQRQPNDRIVRTVNRWNANIEIRLDHLINGNCKDHKEALGLGQAFPMGKNPKKRFITVIRGNG